MMGNENQSMQMLSKYDNYNNPGRVNYILVFTVSNYKSQAAAADTLQFLPDMEMKENGFGWLAFQEQQSNVYPRWLHECNNINSMEG